MKRRSGAAPPEGSARPCCGAYDLMPGAIAARFISPRELSGRFSISARTTGAETERRCTSTCFTWSAVTVTAESSVAPRSSWKSRFARCPTPTCTVCADGLKPIARTCTV